MLLNLITSTFAGTIMKIGYGIAVQESDDPYISIAEEVVNGATEAGIPGAFWVDFFPILKYVPSWFPGASFQKKAERVKKATNTITEKPFRHVQEQLVRVHFLKLMNFCEQWLYRKVAKLYRPWQQVSLSVFPTRAILNGPGKKRLRKM